MEARALLHDADRGADKLLHDSTRVDADRGADKRGVGGQEVNKTLFCLSHDKIAYRCTRVSEIFLTPNPTEVSRGILHSYF